MLTFIAYALAGILCIGVIAGVAQTLQAFLEKSTNLEPELLVGYWLAIANGVVIWFRFFFFATADTYGESFWSWMTGGAVVPFLIASLVSVVLHFGGAAIIEDFHS